MAISVALVDGASGVGQWAGTAVDSSFATSSLTPTADLTYAIHVNITARDATVRTVDSVSGWGLTWQELHEESETTDYRTGAVWVTSGDPGGGGTITVGFSSTLANVTNGWAVYEISDTDTGTDDGVVSANADGNNAQSSTFTAMTLASFQDATNNAAFMCGFGSIAARNLSGGGGYTEIHETDPGDGFDMWGGYLIGEDLSPQLDSSSSQDLMALSFEVRAADIGQTLQGSLASDSMSAATGRLSDADAAVIALGVGLDDENVPISLDTHNDLMDHSDLYRHTASPATSGSIIQDNITPSQGDTIVDNDANSTVEPSGDTTYFYILRDWEEVGESTSHDSNEISVKTAPDRPTNVQVS